LLALVTALVAAHPILFFGASDVPALRQAAQTTHASIASHITGILDQHLSDPTPTATEYDDFRFLGNQVAVWAFGYQLSGNPQYAAIARSQLLTYASWIAWDNGETAAQGGPDLNEAHMLLGASVAYDWIYETLSAADRATIATKLGIEALKVGAYLPSAWWVDQYLQNHNWIDTAGLGMAALALQGEDARAAGWLTLAQTNLQRLQLSVGAIPDGSWHEGLPYEGYGLAMALPFWVAMRHLGADYTDMGLLRGYGKFYLTTGIPDSPQQLILPFGDFTHWPAQQVLQVLRFTAARFRDGYAVTGANRYIANVPRGNFLPELWYDVFEFLNYDPTVAAADIHTLPLDSQFPDIGAAVLHSSYDPGDFTIGFKAGVYGGNLNFNRVMNNGTPCGGTAAWGNADCGWVEWGHDHNDDMSFWLFGSGTWLAPEAMGYDAGKTADYTYPASQTAYHNAMLVDGQGQLGDTRVSDSNWNNPWFWQRQSSPLLPATGTAHYAIAGGKGAHLFDASLAISRWDRIIVMARGRYALVRDDVEAAAAHAYDWICHFQDGAVVDTATGWVQGIGKNGQSLGVRVLSPASWTATTGSQTATLMSNFDPDGQTSYVRVRPSSAAAQQQFLTALMPVPTASWSQRTAVDALSSADPGAGAVVAKGSSLEERWIFARAGSAGKTAGNLVLSGALAGMAARDASGAPLRSLLFGAGQLFDQSGARLLVATSSATAIEASVEGTTLSVTGSGIADFQAYAPSATAVTLNGQQVSAKFEAGMVIYPGSATLCCTTPPDAGTPDGGSSADAGSGSGTSNGGGGNIAVSPVHGCSSSGATTGWLMLAGVLALVWRRR
jgi:MYXO-CTERM domain-containing protein